MSKKISTETLRALMTKQTASISTTLQIGDTALDIIVQQYLPIEEKMVMVQQIINGSFVLDEEAGIKKYNNMLADIILSVLLVKNYTNISLTDDAMEMYNIIISTGILMELMAIIPQSELEFIKRQTSALIQEEQQSFEKQNATGLVLKQIVAAFNSDTATIIETVKDIDGEKMDAVNRLVKMAQDNGIIK